MLGIDKLFFDDLVVHEGTVLVVEGWEACEHLVKEGTKGVEVDHAGVMLAGKHIGGHVLG